MIAQYCLIKSICEGVRGCGEGEGGNRICKKNFILSTTAYVICVKQFMLFTWAHCILPFCTMRLETKPERHKQFVQNILHNKMTP